MAFDKIMVGYLQANSILNSQPIVFLLNVSEWDNPKSTIYLTHVFN